MWLVTNRGFYSTAVDENNVDQIMVRARLKRDLEALREYVPDLHIRSTPDNDYPFRAFVVREAWENAVARMVADMDYNSFTGSVERRLGRWRRSLNKRAWAVFAELDERGDNRRFVG